MSDAMTPRLLRRPTSPPAPAPPLDDDNLLEEILLRLPPLPSSLPRAAAVCKRWRRLVSDPQFRRLFRAHHRDPPLLGVFVRYVGSRGSFPVFRSVLDPPDAIPPERFSFQHHDDDDTGDRLDLFDCRHGHVLVFNYTRCEVIVWNPDTGDRRCVAVPPAFDDVIPFMCTGAVLCAAGDQGHESPYQVVLIGFCRDGTGWYVCVYSLETGEWGDLASTAISSIESNISPPCIRSGDSLYWLFDDIESGILEFDLGSQSLTIIDIPPDVDTEYKDNFWVLPADDGSIGLAYLTNSSLDMWERKVSCDGGAKWVIQKTLHLEEITGLSSIERGDMMIYGYDECANVIFLWTSFGVFMVQLDSVQFRNLGRSDFSTSSFCHPYRNFLC